MFCTERSTAQRLALDRSKENDTIIDTTAEKIIIFLSFPRRRKTLSSFSCRAVKSAAFMRLI